MSRLIDRRPLFAISDAQAPSGFAEIWELEDRVELRLVSEDGTSLHYDGARWSLLYFWGGERPRIKLCETEQVNGVWKFPLSALGEDWDTPPPEGTQRVGFLSDQGVLEWVKYIKRGIAEQRSGADYGRDLLEQILRSAMGIFLQSYL